MKLNLALTALIAFNSTIAFADDDLAKGERVFKKCMVCHDITAGPSRKMGPNLFGLIGRSVASTEGYNYSPAMKTYGAGKTWSKEMLNTYLNDPRGEVPRTKMAFPGLKKEDEREALIAYLAKQK